MSESQELLTDKKTLKSEYHVLLGKFPRLRSVNEIEDGQSIVVCCHNCCGGQSRPCEDMFSSLCDTYQVALRALAVVLKESTQADQTGVSKPTGQHSAQEDGFEEVPRRINQNPEVRRRRQCQP